MSDSIVSTGEAGAAIAWHACDLDQVLSELATRPEGLTEAEVEARQSAYGPNRLVPPKRTGPVLRLLSQFHNVLIYVLIAAGILTAVLGHFVDAGVIFGVVVINAVVGFIQEGKAERALEAVRNMLSAQAMVFRQGRRFSIPADQLVPGDVVFVQSGDRVPADLRLFKVRNLRIEEAILTGESLPVEKHTDPVAATAPLGERYNQAFTGTLVTFGQGSGVVTATAQRTEIGRISAMLAEVTSLATPLTRQMTSFARWLTGAILLLAAVTALVGIFVRDYSIGEMFLAAVGIAVAAIPEGLPAVITITLAIGVQRMAGRNAIIRRLPAVETLGSVTTICSDKTGTLTRNEMMVQAIVLAEGDVEVTGVGYNPHGGFTAQKRDLVPLDRSALGELCRAGLLCNDASIREVDAQWRIEGDPTEGALVTLARKAGFTAHLLQQEFPRDDAIPFESEHRFMATLHHDHQGKRLLYLKGAPEMVLERCDRQRHDHGDEPLDVAYWGAALERLAAGGLRTLALAMGEAPTEQTVLRFDDVAGGLTLLGIVGITDPPRPEAIEAVRRCRSAGIRVKMITGDHAATSCAVAAQVGLAKTERAITGAELERMDDAELHRIVDETDVFARTSPEHKLRLVQALQASGQVVAMTGDGVNDAPALKQADIGVAMGIKGTEAAKEAAEMVLADDNFASIAHAVEQGRTVYDNIKKAILFILPTNGGEGLALVVAIAMGGVLPATPVQILWVNMIAAVTLALAMAFEPTAKDTMSRPPRNPREPMLAGFLTWQVAFVSLLIVGAIFGSFRWERFHGGSVEVARTVAVNALVVVQGFYLLNTRYERHSVLNREGLLGNPYALGAIALVLALQVAFTYLPFMQSFFGTAPIGWSSWARIFSMGLAIFLLIEAEKLLLRRSRRRRGTSTPPTTRNSVPT